MQAFMMRSTRIILLGAVIWLAGGAANAAPAPKALVGLDAYIGRVLNGFQVPGLALAVVKDDSVVLEKGYGVREVGHREPVDANTLFAIASNTKAFTSTALAILVDAHKLDWSDRVIDHLPWFAMSDAYVTREMTIRDLLVHRSGLGEGAGDLLFTPATLYSAEELVRRLRYVPLRGGFRDTYAYDNVLYAVAGQVIEHVSGQSWTDFVREHIFEPVGMKDTKATLHEIPAGANVATGHVLAEHAHLQAVPMAALDSDLPAGGVYSTAHDMGKWVRVHLNEGKLPDNAQGGRLFSYRRQWEMWSMVTPMPIADPPGPALAPITPALLGYGLGWVLSSQRGLRIVSHTGGWAGQVSTVFLVPDMHLGIVILTNQEVPAAFRSILWRIIDGFQNVTPTDWAAIYLQLAKAHGGAADDEWTRHVAARDANTVPSLPLARYAGTYRDPWYGDVSLTLDAGRLVMKFSKTPRLVGDLEHWQHDTFLVRWRERALNADAFVTFSLTPDGAVDAVSMQAASGNTDFSYDFQDLRLKPVH